MHAHSKIRVGDYLRTIDGKDVAGMHKAAVDQVEFVWRANDGAQWGKKKKPRAAGVGRRHGDGDLELCNALGCMPEHWEPVHAAR